MKVTVRLGDFCWLEAYDLFLLRHKAQLLNNWTLTFQTNISFLSSSIVMCFLCEDTAKPQSFGTQLQNI